LIYCIILFLCKFNCIRTWIRCISRFIKVYINNLFGIQYRFDIYKHKLRTYSAHSCFAFLNCLKYWFYTSNELRNQEYLSKKYFFSFSVRENGHNRRVDLCNLTNSRFDFWYNVISILFSIQEKNHFFDKSSINKMPK